MLKIGITGGIGSGKSTVCRIFEQKKIPVYNADLAAKRIMNDNETVKRLLTEVFGNIYINDQLDRNKLSSIIFNSENALEKVNAIVHPAVIEDYKKWETMLQAPYLLRESAILFESGTDKGLDYIIVVTAPETLRIKRITERDGKSEQDVNKIIASQMSEEEKKTRADYIIINDGLKPLLPQVWKLHDQFTNQNG
jgi:dephospho-CoA kinase